MWQSLYGVILIGIIVNGMRLMGLNIAYHDMVKGIIIIIAVALMLIRAAGRVACFMTA